PPRKILDLCRDPETSTRDLAECVGQDPALTAKVLRGVSAPLYGFRSEITTLSRGTALLGLNGVRSIAISFSLVRGLQGTGKSGFDHRHYRRRSILAAVAARTLVELRGIRDPEELLLAGLLQDIGMLVFSETVPKYPTLVDRARQEHAELARLEQESFGGDHAALGAWLLRQWGLPDLHVVAAAASHGPSGAEGAEGSTETASLFEVELDSPEVIQGALMEAKKALVLHTISTARELQVVEEAIAPASATRRVIRASCDGIR
ncbi:MAG: HDOD domain-containing protein, partial [Candidatus Eisenbacteria bacterium]|nr:HDOD domain-containing protein [Candidatus Eisenbacteria bacterium]